MDVVFRLSNGNLFLSIYLQSLFGTEFFYKIILIKFIMQNVLITGSGGLIAQKL